MKQVKIFNKQWDPEDLESKVNEWIKGDENITIEEIKYLASEGYHYCMIIYYKGIKI